MQEEKLYNWWDSDVAVVMAAISGQHNYMVYKDGKEIGPTKSKKQWMKDNMVMPKFGGVKGPQPPSLEGITFVKRSTLKKLRGGEGRLDLAKATFRRKHREVCVKYPNRTTIIVIDGGGNFRDAVYPDYKGNRNSRGEDAELTKVILRAELTEWIIETFPNVKVAIDMEADDIVSMMMWKGYQDFLATGVYTHIGSSCDKDLKTTAGYLWNPCKPTDLALEIDTFTADQWFCIQMLYGDKVDNIKGIAAPLSKAFMNELGVRFNAKGVGELTARRLMDLCTTSRECFELLVRCYKDAHGELWRSRIAEESLGLRMAHTIEETVPGSHYDIFEHMIHLEVDFDA